MKILWLLLGKKIQLCDLLPILIKETFYVIWNKI